MTELPGEFELIARLAALFGPPPNGLGIGDDAATWPATGDTVQVATTDMLIEGIHFRLDWTSPEDVGWKALAVNLSDLAAMGATPGRALISIAVDAARRGLVLEVARGLQPSRSGRARGSSAATRSARPVRLSSTSRSSARRIPRASFAGTPLGRAISLRSPGVSAPRQRR